MNGYPDNWPEIATRIKDAAGWRCERCGHPHDVPAGYMLTVHHLDMDKSNCADWNLAALCQRCHLRIQGAIKMDQLFFLEILPLSNWFKKHYEGYLASKGQPPSRELCAYCGRGAEGNFSIHRDGHDLGPEVPLCDACGRGYLPTLQQIWSKIAKPQRDDQTLA